VSWAQSTKAAIWAAEYMGKTETDVEWKAEENNE
jgi:hypothetical protein